jgi:putative flavoprotein involved in K+ transport
MTHRTPNGTRPDVSDTNTRHEVIVVGAGQAGLAIGYFLAQQRRDFTILEADREPAAAWRARWESLKLFTPARYSSLPGLPFPGEPDRYPTRDEVVAYLTDYARHFELPVELNSRVRSVRKGTGAASPDRRGCTSSGCRGCTPGARH